MYIDFNEEGLNLKLVRMLEYQKMNKFLQKVTFQVSLKKLVQIKKLKALCRGHMLLVILTERKLMERFTKKNCKKQIKKCFELKK